MAWTPGGVLVTWSVIVMVCCNVLIFLLSLDRVLIALRVSVSVLTIPRVLDAMPAPMVIDSGDSARFFAANLDGVLVAAMVSVSGRFLAPSLVTVELMVMVSVRVLTTN